MYELERRRVEKKVRAFIEKRRPPVELREEVDLAYRFDGRYVEIFEIRPAWMRPAEKIEHPVARARHVKVRGVWLVYWQRADLKWHKYPLMPEVRTIDAFLSVVDDDELGCFFG